jgi:hypothetical protein
VAGLDAAGVDRLYACSELEEAAARDRPVRRFEVPVEAARAHVAATITEALGDEAYVGALGGLLAHAGVLPVVVAVTYRSSSSASSRH